LLTNKKGTMKKLLLVLAIGSLFAVACNDGGSADTEAKTDSAATTPTTVGDSAAVTATPDSATAPMPVADSTKKDSTKKK
jgi:hypothetical protein